MLASFLGVDYSLPRLGSACGARDFAVICPAKDKGYVKMGEVDLSLWRDFSDILLEE